MQIKSKSEAVAAAASLLLEGWKVMDMNTLGFFLYMEELEKKNKMEHEEVNVELKHDFKTGCTTTNEDWDKKR